MALARTGTVVDVPAATVRSSQAPAHGCADWSVSWNAPMSGAQPSTTGVPWMSYVPAGATGTPAAASSGARLRNCCTGSVPCTPLSSVSATRTSPVPAGQFAAGPEKALCSHVRTLTVES
ncbi:hypothetical protein D3C75_1094700 [compost metagenome]